HFDGYQMADYASFIHPTGWSRPGKAGCQGSPHESRHRNSDPRLCICKSMAAMAREASQDVGWTLAAAVQKDLGHAFRELRRSARRGAVLRLDRRAAQKPRRAVV